MKLSPSGPGLRRRGGAGGEVAGGRRAAGDDDGDAGVFRTSLDCRLCASARISQTCAFLVLLELADGASLNVVARRASPTVAQ